MWTVWFLILVLFSGCRGVTNRPGGQANVPPSEPLPPVYDFQGKPVTLERFRGKVVLMDFWATWCSPCLEELPALERLHRKYRDKGFVMLGISIDEEGASVVKPVIEKHGLTYAILMDTGKDAALYQALGVASLPALFLLDAEGRIIGQWAGKTDKDEIETAIINAIQGTTQASGRTVRGPEHR
jgi:peroxiredoxin